MIPAFPAARPRRRVVRPRNAEVERNLSGRIVGHGTRIVVMRPELGIVIEPLQLVDFVFRFDVAVLGDPHVDADIGPIDIRPIEPGVGDGLVSAVNSHAAGPRAAAQSLRLWYRCSSKRHTPATVAPT